MRRFLEEPYPLTDVAGGEVIRRAVEALRALPAVRAVFLFGSVATGTADALSDYDFAVLLDPGACEQDAVDAVVGALGTADVGVTTLNGVTERFLRSVATFGRLLYERAPGEAEPVLRHRNPRWTLAEMERGRMRDILSHLEECVDHLEEVLAEGRESVMGSWRSRYALDRSLEMAAQDVIDFARHYGKQHRWETPDTPRHAIDLLAVHGLVPEALARSLGGLPGLRARLAYEYRNLDPEQLWADLASGVGSLRTFLDIVRPC